MKQTFWIACALALGHAPLAFADAQVMGQGKGIASVTGGPAAAQISTGSAATLIDGNVNLQSGWFGFYADAPVSFDITLASATALNSFVLWNDRDQAGKGGQSNHGDGAKNFSLDLYGAGNTLLARYTGLSPDSVSEIYFDFGQSIAGVTRATWTIADFYGIGAADNNQLREIGFNYVAGAPVYGFGKNNLLVPLAGSGELQLFPTGEVPQAPVPEPETYAMLLVGLGLVGWAATRRRRQLA